MIKVFGIGNNLLTDDGIGVVAADEIDMRIGYIFPDVEIYEGGTDFCYCLDNIDRDDFVIVIDSMVSGSEPGTVKELDFNSYMKKYCRGIFTSHDESLIEAMMREGFRNDGIVIGIEAYDIDFGTKISDVLEERLSDICDEIIRLIIKQRNEIRKRDGKAGS